MQLSIQNLKPARGSRHTSKKVGRGNASGHGNYSGHGGKGQTARSGGSKGLRLKGFKRLLQSTPKLRGFRSIATKPDEIYLSTLESKFENGATVNLAVLQEKKIVSGNTKAVKLVGTGALSKKIILEGIKCTKSAKAAVEKNGGEVK